MMADRLYRDRSVGLVCFGALEVLVGLAPVGILLTSAGSASDSAAIHWVRRPFLLGVSLLTAAVFCSLGVGSILARRWARALTLIASWYWAIAVLGLTLLLAQVLVTGPRLSSAAPKPPVSAAVVAVGCVILLCLLLLVLFPPVLLLFFGRKDVKATFEARDPRERWTDHCPLPVLGLSLMISLLTLSYLYFEVGHRVGCVFGFVVSGMPAVVAGLAMTVLFAWTAWGLYRLAPWAWWASLALWLDSAATTIVMEARPAVRATLHRLMSSSSSLGSPTSYFWPESIVLVAGLFYWFWIRRFFVPPDGRAPRAGQSAGYAE